MRCLILHRFLFCLTFFAVILAAHSRSFELGSSRIDREYESTKGSLKGAAGVIDFVRQKHSQSHSKKMVNSSSLSDTMMKSQYDRIFDFTLVVQVSTI